MENQALVRLIERITCHFAQRRDALDVIGRFGNRFEHWVKWEAAVGLHTISFIEGMDAIASIAVERESCDLFVGAEPRPASGYPNPAPEDYWIEIKTRSTLDKGPAELAAWVNEDIEKQTRRKQEKRIGHFVVLALVVAHPTRALDDEWIARMLTNTPPGGIVRRLYLDERGESNEARLLAALIGWEV